MKRGLLIARCFLFSLAACGAGFASDPGTPAYRSPHAREIETVQQNFLVAKDPAVRGGLLRKLRRAGRGAADSEALQAAVSAMLPAALSADEAEQLLAIAAANPSSDCGEPQEGASNREFLVAPLRAASQAKLPLGDVEELADIRIDRLRGSNPAEYELSGSHVQQVWRINTAEGATSFASHRLMYAAMSEKLCLVRARILRSEGGELPAVVSTDQPVLLREASMYFDSRTREVKFPRLAPGDLVEIEYRLLPATRRNPWAGYYARMEMFRDGFATRLRRRVLVTPRGMKLYAVEDGVGAPEVRAQREMTTRIWEMRDVPPLPDESYSPGGSTLGPYLHLSTIGSMEEFGDWYRRLLQPSMEMDQKLSELAGRIRAGNPTIEERVRAVYESVRRKTSYLAFEFGIYSYRPYPLATVMQRGFGDCKDKAALMVALLRAAGVDAEFAMVRTRSAGEIPLGAYSVQLYNHALAYVPALKLFLDGTVEFAVPGELPPDDQGALAITIGADGSLTRRTIPFASPEANRISRQVKGRLAEDGMLRFSSETSYKGYLAAAERRRSQSGNLAQSARAALARFYPSVRIVRAEAAGVMPASQEVDLNLEGELDVAEAPNFSAKANAAEASEKTSGIELPQIPEKQGLPADAAALQGDATAEPPPFEAVARDSSKQREAVLYTSLRATGLTSAYAAQIERKNPLLVPATPSEQEQFLYELPPGAQPVLPPNRLLKTRFGHAEVSYWLDGSQLRVETYTELAPITVEPAEYQAFRAFCRAADRALRREIRILLP